MTNIYALIPVKELDRAKMRLAPVLDSAARRELVLAMLRDVLDAAVACRALDGVVMVSRGEGALAVAREAGAEGMTEAGGLNASLTAAAKKLGARGVKRLLVLAADLPLADSESIAALLECDAEIALVPSRDGGTNALAMRPGAIELQFGPESARKHIDAAGATGLRTARLDLPRLALDIDTPDDLDALRDAGGAIGKHTLAALERSPSTGSGQGLPRPATNR